MRAASPGRPHLSYCTNVHPGESLAEVRAAVESHVAVVKRHLGVDGQFGVGLRLSARAATELAAPGALESFRDLLDRLGLYVFTINGFPHGTFHGERIKEAVYRPDWLEPARLVYTDQLAHVLAALLPEGVSGSISSVPGAFQRRARAPRESAAMAAHVVEHAATLFRIRETTGKLVELALEPEPCCFLETTEDAVRFFETRLFSPDAAARLAALTGTSVADAEVFLHRHVGICLDACHLAVEFENANAALARLRRAGIRIGKVQVTTALSAALSGDPGADEPTLRALERFADGVYLHQVVERREGTLIRHLDLPEAIALHRASGRAGPSEWRVHFHVPVFAERLDPFGSTQAFLRDLLDAAAREQVSEHLEVETYTWDVLPPEHRQIDVNDAMAREIRWTLERLRPAPARSDVP